MVKEPWYVKKPKFRTSNKLIPNKTACPRPSDPAPEERASSAIKPTPSSDPAPEKSVEEEEKKSVRSSASALHCHISEVVLKLFIVCHGHGRTECYHLWAVLQ
jgi:hypothetical protein